MRCAQAEVGAESALLLSHRSKKPFNFLDTKLQQESQR